VSRDWRLYWDDVLVACRKVQRYVVVIYIAKLEHAIYVLHCFQKKARKTARQDLELATARYKALVKSANRGST